MAINLQNYKVPVFQDVNDTPIVPTASTPGNGSHLIQQHNFLTDEVESNLNLLETRVLDLLGKSAARWIVVEDDYVVENGGTVFVKNNQPGLKTTYMIYAPDVPPLGTTFSYMSANQSVQIELRNYQDQPLWVNTNSRPIKVHSTIQFELITVVYLGAGFNWYQVAGTPLIKEFANS